MNIRRFTAQDMRDALRDIRSTLGPDAVMLSSRKTLDGVEVIAAIDYDDHLLAAVGDKQESDAPAAAALEIEDSDLMEIRTEDEEPPTYEEIAQAMKQPEPAPAPESASISAEISSAEEKPSVELSAEIKDLRRLLEGQMASLAWNDLNQRAPGRARSHRNEHS